VCVCVGVCGCVCVGGWAGGCTSKASDSSGLWVLFTHGLLAACGGICKAVRYSLYHVETVAAKLKGTC